MQKSEKDMSKRKFTFAAKINGGLNKMINE